MSAFSDMHADSKVIDRRTFFRLSGTVGLAAGTTALLAACSSSSNSASKSDGTTAAAGAYGTIALQLSWIKNIEFAGEYFATEKGYYTNAGFKGVTLLGGGGQTGTEAALLSGQCLIGLSSPPVTAASINQGAPLKIIASTYQKNPFCLLSLDEKTPIKTVKDLKGKVIGVQSGDNETTLKGFLAVNNLTDDVKLVTTQYSIAPLEAGKYDAHMSYTTNEPLEAKADGYTPVVLTFADNGLPFVAETYTVTQDTLNNKRDLLKAFLKAEIQGWTDAVKNPTQSATYAVTKYGKDQNLAQAEQIEEMNAQNALILTEDVNTHGLFTMTDELIAENIKSLALMDTKITSKKLFDLSLVKEVYKENPDLITKFPIPAS